MKGSLRSSQGEATPGKAVGLCTECAIRHHDYVEILHGETDNDHSEMPFPRAWVDGKRHMLLSRAWTHQETCVECDEEALSLYFPIL